MLSEGFFGTSNVLIDKSMLVNDGRKILTKSKHDEEYFNKMERDGIYLDVIKNLIYSYNLQKVEQRCLREVNF